MKWQAVLVVVLGTGLGQAANPAKEAAPTDQDRLQGTWKLVKVELEGKADSPKGLTLVIRGTKAIMKGGPKGERVSTFKLQPDKTPRRIDLNPPKGAKNGEPPARGIYELKGNTLRLCVAAGMPRKGEGDQVTFTKPRRPTAFDSQQGTLFTLKRVKAKPAAE